MRDIACILILFKRRHHLSIECVSDLLSLLLLLGVDNVPRSWYQLKQSVAPTNPARSYFTPCEHCSSPSSNRLKCSNCGKKISNGPYENTFMNFSIRDQLEIILNNNNTVFDAISSATTNSISDIRDGNVYRKLGTICHERFLTFTMNIDGVEVKKGSKVSIWPVLLVINELPFNQRYNLENTIIAGVWLARHKPSRTEMKCLLSPVMEELSQLEQEYTFVDYSKPSNKQDTIINVFLIAACCDKPAQALIQNIPEPIAAFGCGRCEIEGKI